MKNLKYNVKRMMMANGLHQARKLLTKSMFCKHSISTSTYFICSGCAPETRKKLGKTKTNQKQNTKKKYPPKPQTTQLLWPKIRMNVKSTLCANSFTLQFDKVQQPKKKQKNKTTEKVHLIFDSLIALVFSFYLFFDYI